MSTVNGQDADVLARETERAQVERAKAELEAEREKLRAELALLEEEERMEAEKQQQNTQSSGSATGAFPSQFRILGHAMVQTCIENCSC